MLCSGKHLDFEQLYKLTKSFAKNKGVVVQAPNKPVTKPVPDVPAEKPTAVKPVEKPAPTKPAPTKPAPKPEATPPAKPAPEKPAEVAPVKPAKQHQMHLFLRLKKLYLILTNAERQKAGLKPLQTDTKLMNSARTKINRYGFKRILFTYKPDIRISV